MPTPDASQYTQIKRIQANAVASVTADRLKFRASLGLSGYGFSPGIGARFPPNVLKSNKFIGPPSTTVQIDVNILSARTTCEYILVSGSIVATFGIDITSVAINGMGPEFVITGPRTAEFTFENAIGWVSQPTSVPINFILNDGKYIANTSYLVEPIFGGSLTRPSRLFNAMAKTPGFRNGAIYFPGNSDGYVCGGVSSNFSISGESNFTVMWWQYLDTSGLINNSTNYVFSMGDYENGNIFSVSMEGTGVKTTNVWFNGENIISVQDNSVNAWNHYALIRYNSGIKLYKNGSMIDGVYSPDSQPFDSNMPIGSSTVPLIIGQKYTLNQPTAFNGYISKFLFDREIAVYTDNFDVPYNDPPTNPTTSLLLLCTNPSTVGDDFSENNNVTFHANTITNTPGFAPRPPILTIALDTEYDFTCTEDTADSRFTTSAVLAFQASSTNLYRIKYSGLPVGNGNGIYPVISTSTPKTGALDNDDITGGTQYLNNEVLSLTGGQHLYLMPFGNLDDTLTIEFDVMSYEISLNTESTFLNHILGEYGSYTFRKPLDFTAPATGTYSIIYSTNNYVSLLRVKSTSTPSTFITDNVDLGNGTSIQYQSEDTLLLTAGQHLYLMSDGNLNGTITTIEIIPAPTPISLDTEYSFPITTSAQGNSYTTQLPLVFTALSTASYKIVYSGIGQPIRNVLATTTPATIITDSATKTPINFTSDSTVSLTAGQRLYLMPYDPSNNNETLTIQINAVVTPILLDTEYSFPVDGGTIQEDSTWTSLRPLDFTAPTTGLYIIKFSGLTIGAGVSNLIYGVTSTTTQENFNPSTSTEIFNNEVLSLTAGEHLYLMPRSDQGTTLTIEFDSMSYAISLNTESTFLNYIETENTVYTHFRPFDFTAPATGTYSIIFSGNNVRLFKVKSTSTPETYFMDSEDLGNGDRIEFETEDTLLLTAGQHLYLMSEANSSGTITTIEIIPAPTPISLDTEYSFPITTSAQGNSYTTQLPLVFTASTTDLYKIVYSGTAQNIRNVLSTTSPTTVNTDSATKTPTNFSPNDKVLLTSGQKLYLMPYSLTNNETITIEIIPDIITVLLDVTRLFTLTAAGEENSYTTPGPLVFKAPTTGMYEVIFSAQTITETIYNVFNITSTTTPATYVTEGGSNFFDNSEQYSKYLTAGEDLYLMPNGVSGAILNIKLVNLGFDELLLNTETTIPCNKPGEYNGFTTKKTLVFTAPTTGTYSITFSGITYPPNSEPNFLYRCFETSTNQTYQSDYYDIVGDNEAEGYTTGAQFSLTSGEKLYLRPTGSQDESLTIEINTVPTPLSLDTEYISELTTSAQGNSYTTQLPLVFTAPSVGQYKITYSGVSQSIRNVLSTTIPATVNTDSATKTPSTFPPNYTISLTSGQNLYLMPYSLTNNETITIEINALITTMTVNTEYTRQISVSAEDDTYTIPAPLKFTAPSAGLYLINFNSGLNVKNVLSTTNTLNYITDSLTKTPTNFSPNATVTLASEQVLYLMPHNSTNTQTITIGIYGPFGTNDDIGFYNGYEDQFNPERWIMDPTLTTITTNIRITSGSAFYFNNNVTINGVVLLIESGAVVYVSQNGTPTLTNGGKIVAFGIYDDTRP